MWGTMLKNTQTQVLLESYDLEGSCFVCRACQSTLMLHSDNDFSFFCLYVFGSLGGPCFTVLQVLVFRVFYLADKSPEW